MLRVLQFTTERHRTAEEKKSGVIAEWCKKELSAKARAEFDGLLRQLSKYRAKDWSINDYKPLTGKHAGIYELRFKADKKEYRPLGFLLPPADVGSADLDVLVLLIGACKKMITWTPHDARDTAVSRKKSVLADRSILHDYKF
jgi:hypothetical protein